MIKRYLLWFIWSSWRPQRGQVIRVTIPFFAPWLTTLDIGPRYGTALVVAQTNYTTLTIIPYSFLALLLLPEHPKVHAWLHRISLWLLTPRNRFTRKQA